jgi:zinc transport system substrate-binding protein
MKGPIMRFAMPVLLAMTSPALSDVPRVVVDFGPVYSLVSDVMGDLGQPEALMPSGADPHDFQLRPSQAEALSRADLVFWVGPELVPSLGETLSTLAPKAEVVGLLNDGGGVIRTSDEGGTDPHAWLDPGNGMAWLDRIAGALAARDPANAATYAANAARAVAEIKALDSDLAALLAPVKDRPFVVYHDALGYLTDHYGLTVAGAVELGDASSPSAAQLAEVRAVLDAANAVCVFPEAGRDPRLIAALTEGLTVEIGKPQDLEFIELQAGQGQYAVMLRDIADSLAECLGRGL